MRGRVTDLAGSILETVRRLGSDGLRAIVVCTDGAHNGPTELTPVADLLQQQGVSLYAVGFGRTAGHRDIELVRVATGRRVTLDTEVTPAVVRAFKSIGWGWGGDWTGDTKDYMHFSTNGR